MSKKVMTLLIVPFITVLMAPQNSEAGGPSAADYYKSLGFSTSSPMPYGKLQQKSAPPSIQRPTVIKQAGVRPSGPGSVYHGTILGAPEMASPTSTEGSSSVAPSGSYSTNEY